MPLTGAAALRAETPWVPSEWIPAFLAALAAETDDALQLLCDLERGWLAARGAVAGRRRHSRAAAAIDLLAAAPLVSASSLATGLGMAVKNAAALLEQFQKAGIVVEVTHRSKRRLYRPRRAARRCATGWRRRGGRCRDGDEDGRRTRLPRTRCRLRRCPDRR